MPVLLKNFPSLLHFVRNALSRGMTFSPAQLQIREFVVRLVAIFVVNDLHGRQQSSQMPLHYYAMLRHVGLAFSNPARMVWHPKKNVSSRINSATAFPIRTLCAFQPNSASPSRAAIARAELCDFAMKHIREETLLAASARFDSGPSARVVFSDYVPPLPVSVLRIVRICGIDQIYSAIGFSSRFSPTVVHGFSHTRVGAVLLG
jgi:hypothetical protein